MEPIFTFITFDHELILMILSSTDAIQHSSIVFGRHSIHIDKQQLSVVLYVADTNEKFPRLP